MSVTHKRKIDHGQPRPGKRARTSSAETKKGPAVRGDALRWRQVSLPDRMEDAEGLYGLEEIEDVEVVRDEQNGVMFRSKHLDSDLADLAADVTDQDDESWNGFDADTAPDISETIATDGDDDETKHVDGASLALNAVTKPIKDEVESGLSFGVLNKKSATLETDITAWRDLELSQHMLVAISGLGFGKPTTIQSSSIPPIIAGQNVVGKAVTGSGKTLAFGIPILETWLAFPRSKGSDHSPLALILAPTRELAHQLDKHLTSLADGLDERPRIVKVTGGLSILKQQRQLQTADIIIGTPGRLWEVINESSTLVDGLRKLRFLVVDEADRLLSEGHFQEVEDIITLLDKDQVDEDGNTTSSTKQMRQTLVFSATFHKGLHQKLAGKLRHGSNLLSNLESLAYLLQKLPFSSKPLLIDSNPVNQMSDQLDETIVESPAMEKDLYLYTVLLQNSTLKTLVFTNSISAVKRITPLFQTLGLPSVALHSSMPQKSRLRALERFTSSSSGQSILIATDVAARGLDIKAIDLIIHYHVPRTADMYVHRSGRTARAEASGRSVLLCSPEEVVPTTRLIAKVHSNGKTPQTHAIEREIIKRLRPRVELAQKIVDVQQAQEKTSSKDDWMAKAAEELGVDYDSDEFEAESRKHFRGRGGDKARKMKEKGETSKAETAKWKAELKELLSKRVNLGVSERYLAGGRVDINALIDGQTNGLFLEARV